MISNGGKKFTKKSQASVARRAPSVFFIDKFLFFFLVLSKKKKISFSMRFPELNGSSSKHIKKIIKIKNRRTHLLFPKAFPSFNSYTKQKTKSCLFLYTGDIINPGKKTRLFYSLFYYYHDTWKRISRI